MIERIGLHVVGVSHRTAGVEVRERFSLTPACLRTLLQEQALAGRPALFLSTCNRSELYWSGPADHQEWFTDFARGRGVVDTSAVRRWDDEAAVRHLFEVTAGLDSQVLGESEILGQVRRAYDIARAAGTTTWEMDLVFSAALAAGRRVRRETKLGRHPASVSSAAVDVVMERLGSCEARNILVLGAGEAAEGVLRALHECRAAQVMLVNRRPERARALADAWGARVGAWDALPGLLVGADVVFVATGAKHPILSTTELRVARDARHALGGRGTTPLVVVDLSVPRNVEPAARGLPHIELLDLDDLRRLRCPVTGDVAPALDDARRVLEDELVRVAARLRSRAVAPKLADLHRFGHELAAREAAWAIGKLNGLSAEDQRVVREMADRLVRRVLYPVSRAVRAIDP